MYVREKVNRGGKESVCERESEKGREGACMCEERGLMRKSTAG